MKFMDDKDKIWRLLSISELTPIISHTELTHLGSDASI